MCQIKKAMKGEKAIIKSTREIKIINDYELIDGVDIFYMSDNTSYSSDSLEFLNSHDFTEDDLVNSHLLTQSICMYKKFTESTYNFIISLSDYSLSVRNTFRKKKKTKTIKIFGWTITFSKSK